MGVLDIEKGIPITHDSCERLKMKRIGVNNPIFIFQDSRIEPDESGFYRRVYYDYIRVIFNNESNVVNMYYTLDSWIEKERKWEKVVNPSESELNMVHDMVSDVIFDSSTWSYIS